MLALIFLICLCWLLLKILRYQPGSNVKRVDGGFIVDPGGRDSPYFVPDRSKKDKEDEEECDDDTYYEEDPDFLNDFFIIHESSETGTPEYKRAARMKEGDAVWFKYKKRKSTDNKDLQIISLKNGKSIGTPANWNMFPAIIDGYIRECRLQMEAHVEMVYENSGTEETSKKKKVALYCVIRKLSEGVTMPDDR